MRQIWLSLSLCLAFAFVAEAQPYDFVLNGANTSCLISLPVVQPMLEWVPSGVIEVNPRIVTIAAAGGGRVLAALQERRVEVVEVRPDEKRTTVFAGAEGYWPLLMVVDRAGTMYVVATQGGFSAAQFLVTISADGTLRAVRPLPFRASSIDLAADQCTLFASDFTAIHRFNACTGQALADFVSSGEPPIGPIRILPDGTVLALVIAPERVLRRYDASGTVRRTYTLPATNSVETIALAHDGRTVLLAGGCSTRVFELDLGTGRLVRDIFVSWVNAPESIVSSRGYTAAIGTLAPSDIPTTSTLALLAIVALTAAIAVRRLM
jgi:sugar lactone lactonase YvrE